MFDLQLKRFAVLIILFTNEVYADIYSPEVEDDLYLEMNQEDKAELVASSQVIYWALVDLENKLYDRINKNIREVSQVELRLHRLIAMQTTVNIFTFGLSKREVDRKIEHARGRTFQRISYLSNMNAELRAKISRLLLLKMRLNSLNEAQKEKFNRINTISVQQLETLGSLDKLDHMLNQLLVVEQGQTPQLELVARSNGIMFDNEWHWKPYESAVNQIVSPAIDVDYGYPGLPNFQFGLANVCFFNAALKFLAKAVHESEAFNGFMDPEKTPVRKTDFESTESFKERLRFKQQLYEVIGQILRNSKQSQSKWASEIKKLLIQFDRVMEARGLSFTISDGMMHDSQEVMNFIFDSLNFQDSKLSLKIRSEIKSVDGLGRPLSVLSKNQDPSMSFLTIYGQGFDVSGDLQAILQPDYIKSELAGSQGDSVNALMLKKISNPPPILFIHVNHFEHKNPKYRYNRTIKLTYEGDDGEQGQAEYSKIASVVFSGPNKNVGHYTCLTWEQKDGRILIHDDMRVRDIKNQPEYGRKRSGSYVLAYKLK